MQNNLNFKLNSDPEELKIVSKLITQVYQGEGYISSDSDSGSKITEFLGNPDTKTFVATLDDKIVGTVSLAVDSSDGLPMDVIFREELNPVRQAGKSIAEVCQFVVDKDFLKDNIDKADLSVIESNITLGLLKHVIMYGLEVDLDLFVFTINPKHRIFYESLGALQVGEEKVYPSVNNAPALAYILDIKALQEQAKKGELTHMLLRKLFST
ncbi:MAG: hypothetical protein R3B53_04205 [Candidatus Paceibacterota bacterium]